MENKCAILAILVSKKRMTREMINIHRSKRIIQSASVNSTKKNICSVLERLFVFRSEALKY